MSPSRRGPAGPPALEARDLRRRFGSREALAGLSFRVEPGEIFAILGPNGGGKTTLFRILATLLPPDAGDALVFGASIVGAPAAVRRSLGVVFQKPALDPRLTVLENLLHGGRLHGLHGRDLATRAREALARLSVADRAGDLVGTLSGGLARRVELAKAILPRPRLLLLDEPSTGLDPAARLAFLGLLDDLRSRDGTTSVLTTHHLDEADRADRVAVIDAGRLVALDAPDALRRMVGGDVVLLESPEPEKLRRDLEARFGVAGTLVHGRLRVEAPRGHELVRNAVEAFPGSIVSASFGRPTLEDVFVHLTGREMEGDAGEGAPS